VDAAGDVVARTKYGTAPSKRLTKRWTEKSKKPTKTERSEPKSCVFGGVLAGPSVHPGGKKKAPPKYSPAINPGKSTM